MFEFISFLSQTVLYIYILYVELADELLAHTQSEDEQPDVDVAKQQRLLEQENDGDVSDSGTLTPGRGLPAEKPEPAY